MSGFDNFGTPEHPGSLARLLFTAMIATHIALHGCSVDLPGPDVLDGLPAGGAELDLRIDGYEADLVPVSWMGVAATGLIALVQSQDRNIRFFGPTGEPLGSVGGPGQGPGEFLLPVRGGWRGDTLWISDMELHRVTMISPELETSRVLPPLRGARPKAEDAHRLPELPFTAVHALYPGDTVLLSGQPSASDPMLQRFPSPLVLTTADGTIEHFLLNREVHFDLRVDLAGGGYATTLVPFFPQPTWAVSQHGDRIATLTTTLSGPEEGTFRISVMDARGAEVFSRAYPFRQVPIPRSVVDSAVAASAERARVPELRRAIESSLKEMIPPVYAPAIAVLVGDDGRVWVGLRPTDEGNPWLVLSAEGEPLQRLVLPGNVNLQVAGTRHVWGLERDDIGVQSVVRYELKSPAR